MSRDPFDLVRDWFATFNRADVAALSGFYSDDALLEHEAYRVEGRAAIASRWSEHFTEWTPGFAGGVRRRVRMIGRIESGLIHAEWAERESRARDVRDRQGVSDFAVEHGRIVWQRDVARDQVVTTSAGDATVPSTSSRTYPPRPVVGVGAVIVDADHVVLIKRKYEPLAGQWSLPGGKLELGESLEAGVAREMREETGLDVEVGPVVEVFDRILLDADGRVRYHFVLVDYLCRPIGGRLQAGSDVDDAVWAEPGALSRFGMTAKAVAVIERALSMRVDAF